MRRASFLAAACVLVVLSSAGLAQDRISQLRCVHKIGDNMYRAKDRTVVWTEHCSYDPKCEDAQLRIGSDPRITWRDGSYCWVLKVAER